MTLLAERSPVYNNVTFPPFFRISTNSQFIGK